MIGAIEAGGTKFVLALADLAGAIVARGRIDTRAPGETWPAVRQFFESAAAEHGAVTAFGIASFGPIDIRPGSPTYGTFTTTPKPGWSGARWQDALGSFGVPLTIDSDVGGAALGEWARGAGQGCATLAYTTVGTGIGTGVVHDGRSLLGFSHYESGHTLPPHDRARDPFAGSCRVHRDCLEGLASGTAIRQRWGRALDELTDAPDAVPLIADYLAHLAATLVLLHMPDRLIFGGGVLHAPGLIEAIRSATVAKLGGYIEAPQLDPGLQRYICTPGLGDDAGITGAILLGRSALRQDS